MKHYWGLEFVSVQTKAQKRGKIELARADVDDAVKGSELLAVKFSFCAFRLYWITKVAIPPFEYQINLFFNVQHHLCTSLAFISDVSKFLKQTTFPAPRIQTETCECIYKSNVKENIFPLKFHEREWGMRLHKYSAEKAKFIRNKNEINPKAGWIEEKSSEMKKKAERNLQKQIGLCHMGKTFLSAFGLKPN